MRENLIPQVEQHLWSVRFRRPMFYLIYVLQYVLHAA